MTVGPKEQTQTVQGHFDSCMCKTVGKTDIDIRKYPRAMNEDLDTGKIDDTKENGKFCVAALAPHFAHGELNNSIRYFDSSV